MTKSIPRIANGNASAYVRARKPFLGSSTFGADVEGRYVVCSYGSHWPLFIYDNNQWFFNSTRYDGRTTNKHFTQLHPGCEGTPLPVEKMIEVFRYGFVGTLTKRLVGDLAYAAEETADCDEDEHLNGVKEEA